MLQMAGSENERQVSHSKQSGNLELPNFPGEDPLKHAGTEWKEGAEARLAGAGLLAVANGGYSPAAAEIIDIPLDEIPALPVGDRDYQRRLELRIIRIRVQVENARNEERRQRIIMTAWTEVYSALKRCTETTASILSRELFATCNLATQGGAMVKHSP